MSRNMTQSAITKMTDKLSTKPSISSVSMNYTAQNTTLSPYQQFFHDIHMNHILFWFVFGISIVFTIVILCVFCHYVRKIRRIRNRFKHFPIGEYDGDLFGKNELGALDNTNGRLDIALKYIGPKEKLVVKIIRADNLPMPIDGSIDSYVICEYEEEKFITKTKKSTKAPVFNEKFTFKIPKSKLHTAEIGFYIMDYDAYGEDALLAQKKLTDIDSLEILNEYAELSIAMDEGEDMGMGMGQICVILNNVGVDGLRVTILEAKSLRFRPNMLYKHARVVVKYKTKVIHSSPQLKTVKVKHTKYVHLDKEPYFNEDLVFKYDGKYKLSESGLKIEVHKLGPLGLSACLGYVILSGSTMKSSSGNIHWDAMLDNPRQPIPRWHVLSNPNA